VKSVSVNFTLSLGDGLIDVEAEDLGIRATENVEERDEKCSCPAVS
jgi:hypothetical protein